MDHVLRTRGEFDEALEYIHMNPVVKGLVQDSFAWPWSSARWFVERQGPVEIDQVRLPSGRKSRISAQGRGPWNGQVRATPCGYGVPSTTRHI